MNNRNASITLDWGGDTYTFRLGWGEIIELQEQLDAGPSYIMEQLWTGNWKVQYISQIIRLGLIGGGMEPATAQKLVKSYVETRPPLENLSFAQGILAIALQGAPEEVLGEAQAAQTTSE